MSKLQELIDTLCPNGVEYKTTADIKKASFWLMPATPNYIEVGVPYITSKNVKNNTIDFEDVKYISEEDYLSVSANRAIEKNDLLITMIGTIGEAAFVGDYTKFYGQNMYLLRLNDEIINRKFYYYFFTSQKVQNGLVTKKNASSQGYIKAGSIENLKVPVPPIEVQSEIVKILDNFTELTAELTARKKQYEYYRDELLKPKYDIPMVTLKDIATDIYRGAGIKREQVTDDGIPCVRYGEIYTTYNTWFDKCVSHTKLEYVSSPKYFEHGDILFAITGESVEDIAKSVAYVGNEKCLAGGDIVVLKHNQNPRYLAHVLATQAAREQKSKGRVKSKVVHSNVPSIEQITIPLPPLEIQERYANVLDNFEEICNSLNIGLPAEIEARKKQYEFYREKLLTFAATGEIIAKQASKQASKQADYNALIKLCQYVFGYIYLPLENILKIKNGRDYKQFKEGSIPVYGSGGIMSYIDTFAYDKPSVLIPRKGSIDKLYYVDTPFWNVDTVFYTEMNTNLVVAKYVYYCLQKEHLENLNTAGGVPSLTQAVLNKVVIPIPTIEEQTRIVDVLDRFDALCNDITDGLPAEIEARQKQYEYYRDKLLTFER